MTNRSGGGVEMDTLLESFENLNPIGFAPLTEAKANGRWVYVVVCTSHSPPRAIGASRVLYIGQGNKDRVHLLLKSINAYTENPQVPPAAEPTHHAIAWLVQHNHVRATAKPPLGPLKHLEIRGYAKRLKDAGVHGSADDLTSRLFEARLLNDFFRAHGELPLLNRRHEGWLAGKVLRALVHKFSGEAATKVSVTDWSTIGASYAASAWDERDPARWFGLVWLWPKTWSGAVVQSAKQGDLRGHLLLLRQGSGEQLPEALNPALWHQNTRLVAHCDASCLAGASAGSDGADGKLEGWWSALAKAPNIDQLARCMDERHNSKTTCACTTGRSA
jgi:hypothetical protein